MAAALALTHATYAAKSAGGMSATAEMARREELLPIPFAKLMAVFQDPNLNVEWNPNLIKQSFLTLGGLEYGHQEYHLPWPFNNREMLFRCEQTEHPHEAILVKTCFSEKVDPPGAPAVAPGNVRGRIVHSRWDFRALADGTTHVKFEGLVDAMGSLPRGAVAIGQRIASGNTIAALVAAQRRLQLPPHPRYVEWGVPPPGGNATDSPLSSPKKDPFGWLGPLRYPPSLPASPPLPSRADARAPSLSSQERAPRLQAAPPARREVGRPRRRRRARAPRRRRRRRRPPPPRRPLGAARARDAGGVAPVRRCAASQDDTRALRRRARAPRRRRAHRAPRRLERARSRRVVRLVIVVGRSWSRSSRVPLSS